MKIELNAFSGFMRKSILVVCMAVCSFVTAGEKENGHEYPDNPRIKAAELYREFDRYQLVDVRTEPLFRVMHIEGAHNMPLFSRTFFTRLALLKKNKPIVFYCEDTHCIDANEATDRARQAGYDNVFIYEAGILDWVKKYPDKASLLGQSPINASDVISLTKLQKHTLPHTDFLQQLKTGDNNVLLDIRHKKRRGILSFHGRKDQIPFDEMHFSSRIKSLEKAYSGKKLFVYDAEGDHIQWMQYYIEAAGLSDYYFLEGGFASTQ